MKRWHVVYEGSGGTSVALSVDAETCQRAVLTILGRHPWLQPEMIVGCVSLDDALSVAYATLDSSGIKGLAMLAL